VENLKQGIFPAFIETARENPGINFGDESAFLGLDGAFGDSLLQQAG